MEGDIDETINNIRKEVAAYYELPISRMLGCSSISNSEEKDHAMMLNSS